MSLWLVIQTTIFQTFDIQNVQSENFHSFNSCLGCFLGGLYHKIYKIKIIYYMIYNGQYTFNFSLFTSSIMTTVFSSSRICSSCIVACVQTSNRSWRMFGENQFWHESVIKVFSQNTFSFTAQLMVALHTAVTSHLGSHLESSFLYASETFNLSPTQNL